MSTNTQLNTEGQVLLTTGASISVNGAVHPLSTIKTRLQMRGTTPFHFQGLYRGYIPITVVDGATFAVSYIGQKELQEKVSPFWASLLSAVPTVPIIAFGEGLAVNSQANGLNYKAAVGRALRPAGIFSTLFREIPFNVATLYAAPKLTAFISPYFSKGQSGEILSQAVGGSIAGGVAGALTTPMDAVKTRIHASKSKISFKQAGCSLLRANRGPGVFTGAAIRSLYVGLSGGIMNVIYSSAPQLFPKALTKNG